MENARLLELMTKKVGKSATEKESDELATLLSEYPYYAYLYEILESLKGGRDHFEKNIPKEELFNTGWQHLENKLKTASTPGNDAITIRRYGVVISLFRSRKHWIAAAIAIVLFSSGIFFYYKNHYTQSQHDTSSKIANVQYGNTSKLILADGTKVWLNAGSRLIYPEAFAKTTREVSLEGEAFFEVTKNPNSPFLVHAGKITVKVLGTKFNVKAYNEDTDIETTLISGKVQVILDDDPEKKIILSPREKLTVINPTKADPSEKSKQEISNELRYQVQKLPANSNNNFVETAWMNNKLAFSNLDFENVAKLLERKYDVQIYFNDNKLKQEHISGVFEKENIMRVLEILKMTTRFDYKIEGDKIYLQKKK